MPQSPFLGEIFCAGFNFAPQGYLECNGTLLPISQNAALFSLLGTYYGGDGQTTFALPDLRGRVGLHFGQGQGLQNYVQGQVGGQEFHTLAIPEMPAHTHTLTGTTANGSSTSPAGNVSAKSSQSDKLYGAAANTTMAAGAITMTGGSQAHENRPPFLVLNYYIAVVGIFPQRP